MLAISPDMPRAARSGKESGRPHVLNTVEDERNPLIMAHPVPGDTTVPATELQNLHQQMMLLTARVGLALDRAGIDITGATSTCPPRPLPVDGNLFDLNAFRHTRHGGAA